MMIRQRLLSRIVATLFTIAVPVFGHAGELASVEFAGLDRVQLDATFLPPSPRLVRIEPVTVEFARDWSPRRAGTYLPLRDKDFEDLRADLAAAVRDGFADEFPNPAGDGGWRLRLRLVDVLVNAPDTWEAVRVVAYTKSVGAARLEAELVDSSGQVRLRISDWRQARERGGLWQRTDRLHNRIEFERLAGEWARELVKLLRAHNA